MELPQTIAEKIQKLLALSNSPNEHEAQVAMEMALKLLTKYNMSMDSFIHEYERLDLMDLEEIHLSKIDASWHGYLLNAICYSFFCLSFTGKKQFQEGDKIKTIKYIGLAGTYQNRKCVYNLYLYLKQVLPHIAETELKRMPYTGPGTASKWKQDFILGACTRLKKRLEERRQSIVKECAGIVPYDPHLRAYEINLEYLRGLGLQLSTKKEKGYNKTAFSRGYEAGGTISIDPIFAIGGNK